MYKNFCKRTLDIFIAFFGLILFSPLLLILTVLLMFINKGSPFFFQVRPGKNEKLFTLVKFRSMNNRKDESGVLLSNAERLTTLGKWIRKTSLDELPQLFNMLKGEMSLIGPRPLLVEYLPLYTKEQKRRHEVRPGITGWAQIHGRNTISWREKFQYDIWYVDHLSFQLDVQIFFSTIKKVLRKEGINNSGQVAMPKFDGWN